jgi:hypothetical protein
MRPQGWHHDPYGNHHGRWFSGDPPTNLARDHRAGSHDPPPRDRLPEWRWWTVCLPGVLALAVAGLSLLYVAAASSLGCMDGCLPVTEGRPVGTAADAIVAIAAVALLVVGLTTPGWRRATAAALWVALALACGGAVLIGTARPVVPVAPAGQPSAVDTPSLGAAACTAIGGRVIMSAAICFGVPYVSNDGQRDYGAVSFGVNGLTGPADTAGTGATRAECESGRYPDGPTGPVTRQPGHWYAQLSLCMP